MKTLLFALCLVAALLTALPMVAVTNVNVSVGGNLATAVNGGTLGAGGNCVAASGWRTIPNIGLCVHLTGSGNYTGGTITVQGTSSAGIAIIADTRWAPIVTSQLTISNTLNLSYITISGLQFTNPSSATAILLGPGSHRTIEYNYLHDFFLSGTCTINNAAAGVIHETTAPMNHDTIDGNIIRHFGNIAGCATWRSYHGIYADGASLTITNNIISGGTGGWGIQKQYAGNADCTPGVISNNTIFNNAGGIVINNENSSCGFNNWTISNNIIVNNGISGTGGQSDSFGFYFYRSIGNSLISNNLLYGNLPSNVGLANGASNTSVNQKSDSSTSVTFATFQSDTNSSPTARYNMNNYQIKAGSQAANGTASGLPGLDIALVVRSGTSPDIGGFNFAGGQIVQPPSAPTGLTTTVK